jgi:hypothetical protein
MRRMQAIIAGLLLSSVAMGGEVYVTRDASGNPVYTDRPATLPAEKLGVRSNTTDPAEVQARYDEQMKRYAADSDSASKARAEAADTGKAREVTADDRAKRCVEARNRYEATLNAIRLYEEGPDGQRRYLSSEEIDGARVDARKTVDEFCAGL